MARLLALLAPLHPPWNVPKLVGRAIGLAGCAFLLLALKKAWFLVPVAFENKVITESGITSPEIGAITIGSQFESGFKLALILGIACLIIGLWIFRKRPLLFAKTKATVAIGVLAGGILFTHLTISDDTAVGAQAAWVAAQFDNLTWFGGDIYTGREYEYAGEARDLLIKDPPQFVSPLTPPSPSWDLAVFGDILGWLGLNKTFWFFLRAGWGSLMVGGSLLLISALATRLKTSERGLSSEIVRWVGMSGTAALALLSGGVILRIVLAASSLETAREAGDTGQYEDAVRALDRASRILPALDCDTGIIFQRGAYTIHLDDQSPIAKLYQAYRLEAGGHHAAAETIYRQLGDDRATLESADEVTREAFRGLFRIATNHFNSGRDGRARELLSLVREQAPALPKAIYLQLLLEVRQGDYRAAEQATEELRVVLSCVQIPLSKGVVATARQHLAQLAYDQGAPDLAWLQWNLRKEGK